MGLTTLVFDDMDPQGNVAALTVEVEGFVYSMFIEGVAPQKLMSLFSVIVLILFISTFYIILSIIIFFIFIFMIIIIVITIIIIIIVIVNYSY